MKLLGLNGGTIGGQRISRRGAAPGIWTPNEQIFYQRQNAWIGDASFDSVSLLLHMNGSNGSTTFTDSSVNGLTVTPNGNVQISTAQSKFGGASAYFDGSGDFLALASSSLFNFSSGAHTFEMWLYPTSFPGSGNSCRLLMFGSNGQSSAFIPIQFGSDGKPSAGVPFAGTSGLTSSTAFSLNTWQHYAIVMNGSNSSMYINGTQVASGTITQPTSSNNSVRIGYDTVATVDFNYAGYVDDLRITKGVARYSASFTAPTLPFPDL